MVKTGEAFTEHIITDVYTKKHWGSNSKQTNPRSLFLYLTFAIIFTLIFLRVFFLQIIKGQYYRGLSDNNRTKTVVIHAPRGIIFDRNGTALVFNIPGFRENINGKTILLNQEEALSQIAKGKKGLEIDSLRQYPYKDFSSHILGYLGQISKEELKNPKYSDYMLSDLIGKDGIENTYESRLRGVDGKQLFEIDAKGNIVRKLGQDDPVSGQNITLTIDLNLQKKVFEAVKGVKKGAVIVSKPNGEILALVSKPSFDPNIFTLGQRYKPSSESGYLTLEGVLQDFQNQPLLNRAISGVYPPGSTFKLVVAASGLSDKIIDEAYEVEDTGILHVGDFSFANWYYTGYGRTEGNVNVVKAIKRSNDIFFYKLAEKVGIDKISETAKKFGVGNLLGIDLQGEAFGILPTRQWKKEAIGEQWYLGDTYHFGIGQGYLITTPLQVNVWTQVIANNGTLYKPFLLKELKPVAINSNLLDNYSSGLLRQGMIESCAPGGVAWPLFNFKVKNSNLKIDDKNFIPVATGSADMRQVVIACKTGTAEHGGPKTLPHAWITLFAPAYNPQIVVTVLVEESGEGSNVAAPIAKKILEAWFSK